MKVIEKNVIFKKKKENLKRKKDNKTTETKGDILIMCKITLQITKLFCFLFTSSFGSFL